MSLESFIARLNGVVVAREGWSALCPGHDDHSPSLSVKAGKKGAILVKCHAGCATEGVVEAMGLKMADLFPDSTAPPRGEGGGEERPHVQRRIAAVYDYTNEAGGLLFQTVRYVPKDFRQRHMDDRGGWAWNMKGVRRVIYHLPEVLAADPNRTVLVAEGEKDVDNLRALGFVSTCNPLGALKWREPYTQSLKGRKVVVIADKDAAGRKHAAQVAASLKGAGNPSVKVVELPGEAVKDASDWIGAGGTREGLIPLLRAAGEFTAPIEKARELQRDGKAENEKNCDFSVGEVIVYDVVPGQYEFKIGGKEITLSYAQLLSRQSFANVVGDALKWPVRVPRRASAWRALVKRWLGRARKEPLPENASKVAALDEKIQEAIADMAIGEGPEALRRDALARDGEKVFQTRAVELRVSTRHREVGRGTIGQRLRKLGYEYVVAAMPCLDGKVVKVWMPASRTPQAQRIASALSPVSGTEGGAGKT